MIKIVVVEDKPPILRDIKEEIEKCNLNIEIVGEAINGQVALPVIMDTKPDIVFTDIKMPVMDGLQMIAELKKTDLDINFVIISGYDEFEYARQAMRLNATEYLLKPVDHEAMDSTLKKIIGCILEDRYIRQKDILSNILFSKAVKNKPSHPEFENMHFLLVLLCAGPYSNFEIYYTNPLNSFWSDVDLLAVARKYITQKEVIWCFDGKCINEHILVLGLDSSSELDINTFLSLIENDVGKSGVPITLAVSQKIKNVLDLGIEVQFARTILKNKLIFGKSNVIPIDKSNLINSEEVSIPDLSLEKKLSVIIQGQQKKLFYNEINLLLNNWEKNAYTQSTVEKLLKQIYIICKKSTINQSLVYNDHTLEIDEILSISKDYKALAQGLTFIFDQFFVNPDIIRADNSFAKNVVANIESYLKAHFSEQVSISEIAATFNLEPSYLSRMFKNHTGISPMEYLTKLRIEKAKELILSDPNIMLKDIMEIVGYNNQYYFSKIFKTVMGITPSEYRNRYSEVTE
jgi:two-component system, response regulator YesN